MHILFSSKLMICLSLELELANCRTQADHLQVAVEEHPLPRENTMRITII